MTPGDQAVGDIAIGQTGGNSAFLSGSGVVSVGGSAEIRVPKTFEADGQVAVSGTCEIKAAVRLGGVGYIRVRGTCEITVNHAIRGMGVIRVGGTSVITTRPRFAADGVVRVGGTCEIRARSSVPFAFYSGWPDLRLMFVDERSPVAESRISIAEIQVGQPGSVTFSVLGYTDRQVLSGELTRVARGGDRTSFTVASEDGVGVTFPMVGGADNARFSARLNLDDGGRMAFSGIVLPLEFGQ